MKGPMRRILAVDDDPDVLVTIEALLRRSPDVEFRGVETEAEARRLLSDWSPDVALVDLRLAGTSGIDLLRYLATIAPKTRRVLLTAYQPEAFAALGLAATDAHVTIEKDRLVSSIQALEDAVGISLSLRTAPRTDPWFLPDWLFAAPTAVVGTPWS
jgi:DNA-binding NarL/FixJ family response regulator